MRGPRCETVLVITDAHFGKIDWGAWRAVLAFIKDRKPGRIVFLGDTLDLESLSTFPKGEDSEVEGVHSIRAFLNELQRIIFYYADKSPPRVTIVEGNHEFRAYRAIIQPVAKAVRGWLGLTLEEQLRAQAAAMSVWGAFEYAVESTPHCGQRVGQFLLRHGHRQVRGGLGPKHVAYQILAKNLGVESELVGHFHRMQMHVEPTTQGPVVGIASGTLEQDASFAMRPWVQGFTLLELDTKTNWATPYPVLIHNGAFGYAGKVYDGNERKEQPTDKNHLSQQRCPATGKFLS